MGEVAWLGAPKLGGGWGEYGTEEEEIFVAGGRVWKSKVLKEDLNILRNGIFFFSDSASVHSHSHWVEKVGWTAPDFQSQGTFRYGRVGADVSVGSQR